MKKILWVHRKWIPLETYIVLAVFLWAKRATLIYTHLPVEISTILYDMLFISLALLGVIGIRQEIRCPFITKSKVDLAFKQAGVMNKLGQYPVLIEVSKDLSKKRGRRYTIKNVGVPLEKFEINRDSLQRELGVIYKMSDTTKPGNTYLYVLPGKSSMPTITSSTYDDDF